MGGGVGLGVGLGEGVGEGVGDGLGVGVGVGEAVGVGDAVAEASGVAVAAGNAGPPVVAAGFTAAVSHPPAASAASIMVMTNIRWTVFLIGMCVCDSAHAEKHPPLFQYRLPTHTIYYTSK